MAQTTKGKGGAPAASKNGAEQRKEAEARMPLGRKNYLSCSSDWESSFSVSS